MSPAEAIRQNGTRSSPDAEPLSFCAGAVQGGRTLRLGAGPEGGAWKPLSALAPKGRGGRTCARWGKEEERGDAGVIIEKVPERYKTSGRGRRPGVVRRRNSVRMWRGLQATGGG